MQNRSFRGPLSTRGRASFVAGESGPVERLSDARITTGRYAVGRTSTVNAQIFESLDQTRRGQLINLTAGDDVVDTVIKVRLRDLARRLA